MSDHRLIVCDSIANVSRDDWDRLTATDAHGQYGWLRAIERNVREASRPQYFLLYGDDSLIAAAVGYRISRGGDINRLDELLFGRLASIATRLRLTPQDALYFGPLFGHGRHIFWDPECSPDVATKQICLLLDKIAACVEMSGVTFVFGRIPGEDALLLQALREFGCAEANTWPVRFLDVPWQKFAEYVASLSSRGKNMPTKVRRETMAPGRKGVTITRLSAFGAQADKIYELFEQTHRKYSTLPTGFSAEFVEAMAEYHPVNSVMTVARVDGNDELLGCALLLVADGVASGALIGVTDEVLNREAFTYFNLSLYAPIRFCLENRIGRIYLGGGLGNMKRRRGCDDMDVYIFVRPAGRFGRILWGTWVLIYRNWVRLKSTRDDS